MLWILWYRKGWEPETDAAWDGAPAWGCYSTGADVWPGSSIALPSLAAGGRRARHACSTQQTAGRATELRLSALLPRTDAQYPVSFTQTSKQYQNQTHSAFINIKYISTVYSRYTLLYNDNLLFPLCLPKIVFFALFTHPRPHSLPRFCQKICNWNCNQYILK